MRHIDLQIVGLALITVSCAGTESLHVVDEYGTPVEGVLALSGIRQGVYNPCIVASMTDDAGEGSKVDYSRVALFKDGYHPFMDGIDQPYTHMDAPWGHRPDPRVMWTHRDAAPRTVNVVETECVRPSDEDGTQLETPEALPLAVEFFHGDKSFHVTALEGLLIPSPRFYFAGTSGEPRLELRGEEALAFYVVSEDGTSRFKVCLVDRHQMWVGLASRRTDTLRWLWAEVDDLEAPVVLQLSEAVQADQLARIVNPQSGPSFEVDGDLDRIRSAVVNHLGPLGIPDRLQGWLDRLDDAR